MKQKERPSYFGIDAINMHKDEQYVLRHPVRYGNLNVGPGYEVHGCIDDLSDIIVHSIERELKLPLKNFKHFSVILIVPDSFVKTHVRYMMTMLFNLGFKSLFLHLESVMATFAMALPTACVVDIGSSKTSVCCIEEGIIITKSIVRKNFGGDELTSLLIRLLQSNSALHFFP